MQDGKTSLNVRILNEDEAALWDRFVEESPQGTPFAVSSCLDAFSVRRAIFVAEGTTGIEAGIVLARGLGGLGSNPLFIKHLGVLYAPFAGKPTSQVSRQRRAATALMPALRSMRGFDYSFSPGFVDWLPFHWSGYAQETRYSYRIAAGRAGDWREHADSRLRNDLQRATRAGLSFECEVPLADLIELAARTYRRQGAAPPFREAKLEAALRHVIAAGFGSTACIRSPDGKVMAVALTLQDRRAAFLTITGYADDAKPGATSLLIAGLIERALAEGVDFDFEGSMIQPIEAYYRGFGGALTPYFRIWRPGVLHSAKKLTLGWARHVLGYSR